MLARIFLVTAVLIAATRFTLADSPSVTAVLSNAEMEVGETVQLEIRVTGGRRADVPEQIVVDGLEIQRTGTSQRFEMNNLSVTSSVTYNYTVLATKSGTFKIPSQTIRLEGKTLPTPELTLHVVDSSGGAAARGNPNTNRATQPRSVKDLAFAELIVPKKSIYVGESVPAEIRVGIDSSVHFDPQPLLAGPELKTPGLMVSKSKAGRPTEAEEIVNGRRIILFIYKVALTAAKLGRLEFPAELNITMQWPQPRPQSHSPFDMFGMDDFYTYYSQPTEITIRSDPVVLEVKSLPPNAPSGFSGAVGNFTMTTNAKPKTVQVGDPITVTSTITGRGNFDRVSAPLVENESGWHKYPPSSKFTQDDDVGISGSKTFETVLSPNEKKHDLPLFVFSYFDPVKESYVTLRSDLIPIIVEGGAISAPNVALAQPGSPPPAKTKPTPQEKPADILYQLSDRGRVVHSFAPIYTQPIFWTAQLVPLLGLIGLGGWKVRAAKISNREAQRIAALHHEAGELMRKLRRDDTPREYYADASRAIRVKAALVKNVDPNNVDLDTVATAFRLDDDARERFRRLFERSDELQYSGRSFGAGTVSREDRQETLELIESLRA